MYDLIYSQDAVKQLRKLPAEIRSRIILTLERCRIRPDHYLKKLVGIPYHSLRTGDYRAILEVANDKLLILVVKVGHRKNVYDQRSH